MHKFENFCGSAGAAPDQCILTVPGPAVRIQGPSREVGITSIHLACVDGGIRLFSFCSACWLNEKKINGSSMASFTET